MILSCCFFFFLILLKCFNTNCKFDQDKNVFYDLILVSVSNSNLIRLFSKSVPEGDPELWMLNWCKYRSVSCFSEISFNSRPLQITEQLSAWYEEYFLLSVKAQPEYKQQSVFPAYATWMKTLKEIDGTFTASRPHTDSWQPACRGASPSTRTSFFSFNWSISNGLLHIAFLPAFVKALIL